MAVTLPKINISFQQLATSFLRRSERGVAVLLARDATAGGNGYAVYTDSTQLDGAPYTPATTQAIRDALSFAPLRVGVAKVGATGTLAEALALVAQREKTGWITVVGGTAEDWTGLSNWIKAAEKKDKSWKGVVYQAVAPDCMHLVNLSTDNVTFGDSRGVKPGSAYTPSLVGLLAACNVQRGATNRLCANLTHVDVPENPDTVVGAGKFLLVNDDGEVRVGVDVNALSTTDGKARTEDMKYIETVETMDMIRDDIAYAFRHEYLSNYRNSLDNQMLLISSILYYFRQLEDRAILDAGYSNVVSIAVEAQRAAWVGAGKAEATGWDDATVRNTPFKRTVYLRGDVKILGSMGNLEFAVTLA